MQRKRMRTVQPAHWSPNLTPERVRAAWLKTFAEMGEDPGPAADLPLPSEDTGVDRTTSTGVERGKTD